MDPLDPVEALRDVDPLRARTQSLRASGDGASSRFPVRAFRNSPTRNSHIRYYTVETWNRPYGLQDGQTLALELRQRAQRGRFGVAAQQQSAIDPLTQSTHFGRRSKSSRSARCSSPSSSASPAFYDQSSSPEPRKRAAAAADSADPRGTRETATEAPRGPAPRPRRRRCARRSCERGRREGVLLQKVGRNGEIGGDAVEIAVRKEPRLQRGLLRAVAEVAERRGGFRRVQLRVLVEEVQKGENRGDARRDVAPRGF